ncbi:unnamed protein product [Oikopleura dioica]|uniref:RRM domain-containing protein n=1 Tax=Oikopleura dioica TaxID=34765 RepID=E4XZB4_OIKDI|nr:unnamed protein product [Oikopleura dioica]
MIRLASPHNIGQVLAELREYATEVDVDFVRKAVRAIGRCAIKVENSAERCVSTLIELIQTKVKLRRPRSDRRDQRRFQKISEIFVIFCAVGKFAAALERPPRAPPLELRYSIPVAPKYRESRGFGFVTFANIDDAIYAKKDAEGLDISRGRHSPRP